MKTFKDQSLEEWWRECDTETHIMDWVCFFGVAVVFFLLGLAA